MKTEAIETEILNALPVFPLTGMLLLPGTFMPLNIFEQRYRNLVADVLEADRLLGMVQPLQPAADNFGPVGGSRDTSEIYQTGCVGRISKWQRETDGRYLIVLEGTQRFAIRQELSLHHGYRRVRARLLSDGEDSEDDDLVGGKSLLEAALAFCQVHRIRIDADILAALPGRRLVNSLAAALPFRPEEKQALLEASPTAMRATILIQLLEMSVVGVKASRSVEPVAPN